jgi:opacity protein-like surface antigen
MNLRLRAREGRLVAGFAFAVAISTGSGAFAQNCTTTASGPGAPFFGVQLQTAAAAGGAAAGSFAGALGNMSTAFLSQQGSAFVSAPGDPKPDQPGGGVWIRGVGGEVTNKFTSNATGTVSSPAFPTFLNTLATANCPGSVRETFAGAQVGQDIARLNWGGWNLHWGTTAGYLSSHATDSTGGSSNFEVPFLGTYLVATHGRFFADIMVREEFYSAKLNTPAVGVFGQEVGAHGVSVAVSAGYNFALANNWFIEPSAGFIWSRTEVDPFNISGGPNANGIVSTFTTAPIESEIGRLSLRAGTTISSGYMIWQPFASASVFHEFAGNVTSTATSLPNGAFAAVGVCPACVVTPITLAGTNSTTRVGTYGQYSLGLAAQVANTGWLGFVRVDYRNGSNIEGWTGNAGLRYQFTPERIAAIMPTKAPVKALGTVIAPTYWTGFYVGGFLGVGYGKTDIRFVGDPAGAGNNPRVFGGLGGGQIGYNYQVNRWVFGVEGDIGAANLHGARTCGAANGKDVFGNQVAFSPAYLNCQNVVNWMATAAARIGYAWDRTLFYVKAGGAWADDTVNVSCIWGPVNGTITPPPFPSQLGPCLNQRNAITNGFSTSGHRSGWLIGYGTEFDLGRNWSAKAEYDYINFGSRTALANDGVTTLTDSGSISQVEIGVNYRFSGPAAVVARY